MSSEDRSLPGASVERIEGLIEEWIDAEDVPGLAVAVVDGDGIRYGEGFGVRDRESGAPVTPDTLFAVGSVTKPVTATAVLRLVGRGDLALDDPVGEHVPALADVPGEPITVGELLSHSSGMPADFVAHREDVGDRDEALEHAAGAADRRLTDRPRYMYYNSGYFALAELVERVDGRAYEAYVDEEVFAPLGMDRSTFDPAALDAGDAMTGYRRTDDGLTPGEFDEKAGAAGGLISTAADLAALARFVLGDGAVDGERVLSEDLLEAACRYQSPLLPAVDGAKHGYGYGWELDELLGETLVGHRGGIGISGGYVGVLRERGVGVAMAYNALGWPVIPVGQGVLAAACGEDPHEAVSMLRVLDAVEAVSGTYTAYRGAMTVSVEGAPAGTIAVTLEDRGTTFTATPGDVTGEPYRFSQAMGGGVEWVAEFRPSADDLVLSMGKWTFRLRRQE